MANCKYPNEVCANMTMLNSVAYCDSVPCSLKDELPKQTKADKIRSMSDVELAEMLVVVELEEIPSEYYDDETQVVFRSLTGKRFYYREQAVKENLEWLKKEVEDGEID